MKVEKIQAYIAEIEAQVESREINSMFKSSLSKIDETLKKLAAKLASNASDSDYNMVNLDGNNVAILEELNQRITVLSEKINKLYNASSNTKRSSTELSLKSIGEGISAMSKEVALRETIKLKQDFNGFIDKGNLSAAEEILTRLGSPFGSDLYLKLLDKSLEKGDFARADRLRASMKNVHGIESLYNEMLMKNFEESIGKNGLAKSNAAPLNNAKEILKRLPYKQRDYEELLRKSVNENDFVRANLIKASLLNVPGINGNAVEGLWNGTLIRMFEFHVKSGNSTDKKEKILERLRYGEKILKYLPYNEKCQLRLLDKYLEALDFSHEDLVETEDRYNEILIDKFESFLNRLEVNKAKEILKHLPYDERRYLKLLAKYEQGRDLSGIAWIKAEMNNAKGVVELRELPFDLQNIKNNEFMVSLGAWVARLKVSEAECLQKLIDPMFEFLKNNPGFNKDDFFKRFIETSNFIEKIAQPDDPTSIDRFAPDFFLLLTSLLPLKKEAVKNNHYDGTFEDALKALSAFKINFLKKQTHLEFDVFIKEYLIDIWSQPW